ncbi:MAG TPA: MFS transporter [Candidatus Limnocylindria bacterium]|nr:MFS transporter [Candidatus Limnocylindria bacterium]
MFPLLLAVIYLAFISLGLPDSLLGSAWPVMGPSLGVPLSYAGILTMIASAGTIASSLLSGRLIRRFGTGVLTAVSVGMTAAALLGYSLTGAFWLLCLFSIPYGLGAGAVDAALNHYVALHYSSRHMSWLHAFWGVGVTISPNIMGFALAAGQGWQSGYRTVALLQAGLTALLFLTLPLWDRHVKQGEASRARALSIRESLRIPGVPYALIAFFAFCALEATAGLWAGSWLVLHRGVSAETAARFTSLFYLGETAGRFLNGFAANRFGDRKMIRAGILVMMGGAVLLLLPLKSDVPALAGLVVLGFGAAPIYPSIIHSTPENFGRDNAQSLVGIQMASAYMGVTLMPPLFGLIAQHIHIGLYPPYLAAFTAVMLVMTARLNRTARGG